MLINITNFYSLKRASFELRPGINVVAGKNGSGKTQLLAAIASTCDHGHTGIGQFGYEPNRGETIHLASGLRVPIWRPAVRRIGEERLNQDYIQPAQTDTFLNLRARAGYTVNLDARFTHIHITLCNLFLAGSIPHARPDKAQLWKSLTDSFSAVFAKTLAGAFDIALGGAKVGLLLDDGMISKFGQLSNGEREFTLQRSEASEPSWAVFSRAGGGGVAALMVLKEVGQAVGFSRRSVAAQVFPTGQNQGSADLLQGDLRIFPPAAAWCAD